MATPTSIKFSRIRGTPADAYRRLADDFIAPLHLERHSFVRLTRTDDPYYVGYVADEEWTACASIEELVELARPHDKFGSVHLVPYIPGYIYFHVVDIDDEGFTFTAEIDSGLVAWESDGDPAGQWFKAMLTTLCAALGAEVCGYGRAHEIGYEPLDTQDVLARLRSGELLKTWYPTYHAISVELLGVDELRSLMNQREVTLATQDLQHEVSVLGYHALYILP